MTFCFWCGTDKPRNSKADLLPLESKNAKYAPCTDCEAMMASGVTVVEVSDEVSAPAQVPLCLGDGGFVYPTGLWAVVPQEFIKGFQAELAGMSGRYGFCMCSPEVWDLMELQR
jgi:hypothetical protein